jgi:hypothetical protein
MEFTQKNLEKAKEKARIEISNFRMIHYCDKNYSDVKRNLVDNATDLEEINSILNEIKQIGKAKHQCFTKLKEAVGAMLIDVREKGKQNQIIIEATTLEQVNQIINSLDKLLEKE